MVCQFDASRGLMRVRAGRQRLTAFVPTAWQTFTISAHASVRYRVVRERSPLSIIEEVESYPSTHDDPSRKSAHM